MFSTAVHHLHYGGVGRSILGAFQATIRVRGLTPIIL